MDDEIGVGMGDAADSAVYLVMGGIERGVLGSIPIPRKKDGKRVGKFFVF